MVLRPPADHQPQRSSRQLVSEWQVIASKVGQEFGYTYRGHLLDVAAFGGQWWWSAVHRWGCRPLGRGVCGSADSRVAAQRAALAAVDGWPCASALP